MLVMRGFGALQCYQETPSEGGGKPIEQIDKILGTVVMVVERRKDLRRMQVKTMNSDLGD